MKGSKKMSKKQIEKFDNNFVNDEEFEAIEESEDVSRVECLGTSGQHPEAKWYDVQFVNGGSIDIYTK